MGTPLGHRRCTARVALGACLSLVVLGLPATPRAQQTGPPGTSYSPDVVRFLDQATFGPTRELVEYVQQVGVPAYLAEQLVAQMKPYPDLPPMPATRPADCTGSCQRDNYTMYPLQVHFFQNALYGTDQLRQRVAFALGQIFVVSANGSRVTLSGWMGPYQQLLYRSAFGNFRQLLTDVTLSPAMGAYLDMVNNRKFNPTTGVKPNENFSRELLQLFSIGLVMLNRDGTPQRDGEGRTIPTYDQAIVENFSRVFTGWTFAPAFAPGVPNYRDPMVVRVVRRVEVDHDTDEKQLLNGAVNPAGLSAAADLQAALDNIFYHPNVGPFIGKQLIQHLVTSNPSPGYVDRIASVFNDNGFGVRGDLAAVVTAILTDPEARGDQRTDSDYGHLVEPVLFVTRVLRAFQPQSDGVLASFTASMGQDVFRAPSVFNFYPPGYRIVGTGLLGPEFKLLDSATALARINFVNTVVFNGIAAAPPNRPSGTTIDLSPLLPLAPDPDALVAAIDDLLLHRSMSPQMRSTIVEAVAVIPASNRLLRAKTAAYLVASSSQYQVER